MKGMTNLAQKRIQTQVERDIQSDRRKSIATRVQKRVRNDRKKTPRNRIINGINSIHRNSTLSPKLSNIGGLVNSGINSLYDFTHNNQTGLQKMIGSGVTSIINETGPIGQAVMAGAKLSDSITSLAGYKSDVVSNTTAKRAGFSSGNKATEVLSAIPGISTLLAPFSSKMDKAYESAFGQELQAGYGSTSKDTAAAKELSNKRLVFGKNKANKLIQESNMANAMLDSIGLQSEMAKNNNSAQLYNSQNYNLYSGYKPTLLLAKFGTKLEEGRKLLSKAPRLSKLDSYSILLDVENALQSKNPDHVSMSVSTALKTAADATDSEGLTEKEVRALVDNILLTADKSKDAAVMKALGNIVENKEALAAIFKKYDMKEALSALERLKTKEDLFIIAEALTKISNPQKYQLGGKIDKNFIPEGALHKNKHHLEEQNPELEGNITKKGIPVVTFQEDTVIQQAEVEAAELILCLDTTEKIEELYERYKQEPDDELLIECGKFMTKEITKNTEDPGKLKKEIS